jgi:hypothetical protein
MQGGSMNRRAATALLVLAASMSIIGPAGGQTPVATGLPVEERSYENTCDGAQAYFDDFWERILTYDELDASFSDDMEFYLATYRNSNPPPIVEEWRDAQVSFWAALSDFDMYTDSRSLLDAIDHAEEELEDLCGDHDFTDGF